MQALLAFSVHDALMLVQAADIACALSIEALLGTDRPYDERVQALRPHPGQLDSAANLRALLAGSPLLASHRHSRHAVQDAYCLRCAPQVHGAVRDVLAYAQRVIDVELAAVVDNPVVVPDGEVMTTGNFHGEPLAFAGLRGSTSTNAAPRPGPSLRAETEPPWSSTRCLAMERPTPRPPCARVVPSSACRKRSKTWGRKSGAMPIPVS